MANMAIFFPIQPIDLSWLTWNLYHLNLRSPELVYFFRNPLRMISIRRLYRFKLDSQLINMIFKVDIGYIGDNWRLDIGRILYGR
jgi:hypothetical protein